MQNYSLPTRGSEPELDASHTPAGERTSRPQTSVLGAEITVRGNIEAALDLHIEGCVIGDVRCETLILGESSQIRGNIYAARVRVAGAVEGGIVTGDLAIEATAGVTGDITYGRLR